MCVAVIQFGWLLFSSKLDEISIICEYGFQNVLTYVWHNVSLVYKHTNTVEEIKHKHQLFFYYWNICQQILCTTSSESPFSVEEIQQRHTISDTKQGMLVPWHPSNHKPVTMQHQKTKKTVNLRPAEHWPQSPGHIACHIQDDVRHHFQHAQLKLVTGEL